VAADLVHRKTKHPVSLVVDRLEQAIRSADITLFNRIDHAAGAASAGMTMRPTQLLIFGNPKSGTPLMQSAQTIGIELPLKILAWEDAHGQVWVTYQDIPALARRYEISDRDREIANLTAALERLIEAAVDAIPPGTGPSIP
jgi:uncharacterized protein (DUF302 family)